jgi:NTP pyrophosphatase (non-canonical NTP hydrolase)
MNLNKLRDEIHEHVKQKGFYDGMKELIDSQTELGRNTDIVKHAFFAQQISLIHSELSEAVEADRVGKHADFTKFQAEMSKSDGSDKAFVSAFQSHVKNTVEDELADVAIRVLDLCGYLNIDIAEHIKLKMDYNKQRGYKHGKNY